MYEAALEIIKDINEVRIQNCAKSLDNVSCTSTFVMEYLL